jgi:hypothetical protein
MNNLIAGLTLLKRIADDSNKETNIVIGGELLQVEIIDIDESDDDVDKLLELKWSWNHSIKCWTFFC